MTVENLPTPQPANLPMGQLSFAQLREQATAVVHAAQLEKDKGNLLGIPHIITRVTYRPGVVVDGTTKDYVSVEAVIADADTLAAQVRRGRVPNVDSVDMLPVEPEEKVVYNDGSTGIRRQLTAIFHKLGIIEVPNVVQDMAVFDTPYYDWQSFTQTGLMNGDTEDEKIEVPDITQDRTGGQLAIVVANGLRVSIEPKFNKEVFYLT